MMEKPVVLITGGTRGLGESLARSFAAQGYALALNHLANDSEADKTRNQLQSGGATVRLFKADVSNSGAVNQMVEDVRQAWGRIDVLVNNAGLTRNQLISKMSDEEWSAVLAVNLSGPFYCTRAVLPVMKSQKTGSIVNIVSYTATRGVRGAANYAVAKAGVVTLTRNTALEEGRNNIRVNAVMPGFHVTDMNREVFKKREADIRAQHLLKDLPDREEMADFVVRIAELKSVTGQVFAFESRLP